MEYKRYFDAEQLQSAWDHLERAHIIGLAYSYRHSYVHWKMLLFEIRIKDTKEVIGQMPRLLIGGIGYFRCRHYWPGCFDPRRFYVDCRF